MTGSTTAPAFPAPWRLVGESTPRHGAPQVGKPYEYGAAGPDSYDCSGPTQYAYRAAGIELPHSSRSQSEMGTAVDRANLQPGDVVFFYQPVSHVGIYVGDGQMVDAGNEETGVVQRSVDMDGYDFARRIA